MLSPLSFSFSFLMQGCLTTQGSKIKRPWDVTLIFLFAGFASTRFEIKISLLKNAHLRASRCGKEVY